MMFAAGLLVAATLLLPAIAANAAAACRVDYVKFWDNGTGFGANITIRNLGDPIGQWRLTFRFPGNQRVGNGWSGNWSQSGADVSVVNAFWNATIGTGGSVGIGFNGSYTGVNTDPTEFALNGTPCTGQPPAAPQLSVTPTAVTVPEGGFASYSVRLTAPPTTSVTVTSTAGVGDPSIVITSGAALTFTSASWDQPQTVTLAAAADSDTIVGSRTITVAAPGMTPVEVTATESEVIVMPPIVTPTSVFVPEGGSAIASVRLGSQPAGNVTVTTTAGPGDPDLTVCGGVVITFTPANWNVFQTIRFCAAEDADLLNGSRTFVILIPGFTPFSMTVVEIDNDVALR